MDAERIITLTAGGLTVSGKATRSEDGGIAQEVALPVGVACELTTRTSALIGVLTMATGHGITTADTVDLYWTDDAVTGLAGVRYGCTVTAQDEFTITLGAGSGDDLPALNTTGVVTKQVEFAVGFDGDELKMLGAGCDQRAHIDFHTSADVSIAAAELPTGEGWAWVYGHGITNPLAGSVVAKVQASCGSATTAGTLTIAGVYNSVV